MTKNRGLMLVLSSPSGAGKTTISKEILKKDDIIMSISYTTRKIRKNEKEGKDYYFTSKERFKKLVNKNFFLEYAKVFDNFYGTPANYVEKMLSKGKDILFDIDWQGTQQLKKSKKDDIVTIFILPPSKKELQKRLVKRDLDQNSEINKRMFKASSEISHYKEYEYIILNENLEKSVKDVISILKSERLKRKRFIGLKNFINSLKK